MRVATRLAVLAIALVLAAVGAPLAIAAPLAPAASPAPAATRVQALHFGKLVDGKGRVLPDAVVVVEGDRIRAVGAFSATKLPAGAEVVDLTRYTGILIEGVRWVTKGGVVAVDKTHAEP